MPRKRRKDKIVRDRARLDLLLGEALQALRAARAERDRALVAAKNLYAAAGDEIKWAMRWAPLQMHLWRKAGIVRRVWWALTGRIAVRER